ncbi:MAG: efflux RND transporter periplasmic adaptor subunit [Candidatus Paceibacteria bacterium]
MSFIQKYISHTVRFVKRLPKKYSIGGAAALVVLVLIGWHFFAKTAPAATDAAATMTQVSVASVGSLSSAVGPLPVTGSVTSLSQATVLAQTSGEIVTLNHALGDYVNVGSVIASFENSGQKAAVLQAQGMYDAAQAALAKSVGSTAENSQTTSVTSLQSAYSALDDAIHVHADQLFTNPKTALLQLILGVPDSALVTTIDNERIALETTLADAHSLALNATPSNVTANSAAMLAHTQEALNFLNNLIQAVGETPASQSSSAATLAAYQSSLAAARSEVVGAMSSITGAKAGYDSNDLATVQASVKQAEGALAAAQSNLEKTIVRSPISGTIVSLPVTQGSYVSAFTQMAVVSNPGALYIETHVTPSDAKMLSVGNKAIIDGGTRGVITFIAPAIDPATGKIEVKVGIEGDYRSLTDGSIVNVTLDRANVSAPTAPTAISIPIVAVKMDPNGALVFSVGTSSALVAHPVQLGSILGDRIVILDGLTNADTIVTDARGLSTGQVVTVK